MRFAQEFKQFISRGNVVDLAVGVIIGGAFGQIVNSLVNDIIMPPIGAIIGGISFADWKIQLKEAAVDAAGKAIPAVSINIGNFIQVSLNFIIIALAVFFMIKAINEFHRSQTKTDVKTASKKVPEVIVLEEIRDLLKAQTKPKA